MMGSRKFFVLSMALALALVGSGTALGQQFCTVSAPNGGLQVRASGLTEVVDEIHMICLAGQVAIKSNYKVIVDMGAAKITNRIDSSKETDSGDVTLTMFNTPAAFDAADPSTVTANWVAATTGKLIRSNSAVQFELNTLAVAATTGRFALKIKGIRVNAAAVGAGNLVTATVSAVGASIFDDNAIVARPVAGLVSKSIGYVSGSNTFNAPVQGLACAASKKNLKALNDADDEDVAIFDIEVKEGFATAFQSNTNNGMRIRLSFNDIPAGVKVYLRPSPDCSADNGGSGATSAQLGATPPTHTAADKLTLTLMSGLGSDGAGDGTPAVAPTQGYVEVSLSGGSGAMVYQVHALENGGAGNDDCDIPIAFVWTSGVELGSGTVSAGFAPLSSVAAAHVDAVIPRFMQQSGSAIEAITIGECSTTLLFPFVTNQADYDTGIVISNTSQDTFGTTESAGSCEVSFHGSMLGGGAAPDSYTSDSIAAGEHLFVQLSSEAAGFQGYLMARCDFRFAHGAAFLTNGFGAGVPTLGQGYLALVVPVEHGNRSMVAGGHERLGH